MVAHWSLGSVVYLNENGWNEDKSPFGMTYALF